MSALLDRYLMQALDDKTYCKGTNQLNKTFYRFRLIVLIAVTTGMRASEIFGLCWSDVMYVRG
jgi:integrase